MNARRSGAGGPPADDPLWHDISDLLSRSEKYLSMAKQTLSRSQSRLERTHALLSAQGIAAGDSSLSGHLDHNEQPQSGGSEVKVVVGG